MNELKTAWLRVYFVGFQCSLEDLCRCFGLTSIFDRILIEIVQWRQNFLIIFWKCKSCTLSSCLFLLKHFFKSYNFPWNTSCAWCGSLDFECCFSVWNTFSRFDLLYACVEQIGDFCNPNPVQNFLWVNRSDPNPVDVEFALHPQHETSLDSGIQLIGNFNYFKSK